MNDINNDNILELGPLDRLQSRNALRACIEKCDGIYSLIIASVDGTAIMNESSRSLPFDKLAAMNSSLLALAEAMARESGQSLCRSVILENSNGRLVTLQINPKLLLSCIANHQSNLGMVLHHVQGTAKTLATFL